MNDAREANKRQDSSRSCNSHILTFWNATLEQQSNGLPPPSLRAFAILGDLSVCRPAITGQWPPIVGEKIRVL